MNYVSWFWRNSRGIHWNTAVQIVAGIGQVVLGLLMVWLSKLFIDETIREGSADDVLWMVCWLVMTVVGGVILRQVVYWLSTSASVRQTNILRLRIFSNLFRRQLYDGQEIHSGDITSRLAKDIEQISDVTTDTLPQMTITMIQLSGAFLLMRWFDEWLAWALLLLTPFAIVFGKLISRRLRQMTLDIRQDESRIQMQVQEGMEHNAVLRSLGAEQWVTERLDSMQQQFRGNVIRRMRFTVITRLIMGCVFGLGYLLAFVWGGSGLSEGQAQRIAIARGLLHGGDILLLDEISSSLDEETERELYRRIFMAFPQKTMLFITHRSAVGALCDEVIKLNDYNPAQGEQVP